MHGVHDDDKVLVARTSSMKHPLVRLAWAEHRASLRSLLRCRPHCSASLELLGLRVFCNDERTRTFVALLLPPNGTAYRAVVRMIGAVNKAFMMHGLKVFYQVRARRDSRHGSVHVRTGRFACDRAGAASYQPLAARVFCQHSAAAGGVWFGRPSHGPAAAILQAWQVPEACCGSLQAWQGPEASCGPPFSLLQSGTRAQPLPLLLPVRVPAQDPQPHVSFAWVAGDHQAALEAALQQLQVPTPAAACPPTWLPTCGSLELAHSETSDAQGAGSDAAMDEHPPSVGRLQGVTALWQLPLTLRIERVVARVGIQDHDLWELPGS
eukprot:237733-Chlamydomonas_euryale.AAC.3